MPQFYSSGWINSRTNYAVAANPLVEAGSECNGKKIEKTVPELGQRTTFYLDRSSMIADDSRAHP